MNRTEIKKNAKEQLGNKIFHNNWLLAVLIIFVVSAVCTAAGSILPAVGAILLSGPLMYSTCKMFVKQARDGEAMNLNSLLDGFKDDFGGILILGLLTDLFVFLWSLLLLVPGIIKSYAYSFAYYIKADHPDYDWRKCLKESQAMTYGHKWELFVLDLSFIGWFIVGSLALGVGAIWAEAWRNAAHAQAYRELCGEQFIEEKPAPETEEAVVEEVAEEVVEETVEEAVEESAEPSENV